MTAKIAETEVCDSKECKISYLLVRGDQISFVSSEQARKVGVHPLNDKQMPSDVVLPKNFVLVHDTSGTLFDACEMFIVKWLGGRKSISNVYEDDIKIAQEYFGSGTNIGVGSVEVPQGPWKKIAKMRFIRYQRHGYAKGFEHEYSPAVFLYSTQRPLAWKLKLPKGCIVDERGFVRP